MSQQSVTKVIQGNCGSISEAPSLFGVIGNDGSLPIVLCPRRKFGKYWITIPEGVYTIITSKGKVMDQLHPGTYLAPPYWRVQYVVPKQACTYNYDVVQSPTADNVMVKVDVTIVFKITDAETFCYNLGAQKFNDMLKSVCEEAVRNMVRLIDHLDIYELRNSGPADELLTILNTKFKIFGVDFVNSTITNVSLPKDVSSSLQNISTLEQKMNEIRKDNAFEIKKIQDECEVKLQNQQLDSERKLEDIKAVMEVARIEFERKKLRLMEEKEIKLINAKKEFTVKMKNIEAELLYEKTMQETKTEREIKEIIVKCNKRIAENEALVNKKLIMSNTELEKEEKNAEKEKMLAESEKNATNNLKTIRKYELEQKRYINLANMAKKSKMFINGKFGDELINDIVTG